MAPNSASAIREVRAAGNGHALAPQPAPLANSLPRALAFTRLDSLASCSMSIGNGKRNRGREPYKNGKRTPPQPGDEQRQWSRAADPDERPLRRAHGTRYRRRQRTAAGRRGTGAGGLDQESELRIWWIRVVVFEHESAETPPLDLNVDDGGAFIFAPRDDLTHAPGRNAVGIVAPLRARPHAIADADPQDSSGRRSPPVLRPSSRDIPTSKIRR